MYKVPPTFWQPFLVISLFRMSYFSITFKLYFFISVLSTCSMNASYFLRLFRTNGSVVYLQLLSNCVYFRVCVSHWGTVVHECRTNEPKIVCKGALRKSLDPWVHLTLYNVAERVTNIFTTVRKAFSTTKNDINLCYRKLSPFFYFRKQRGP